MEKEVDVVLKFPDVEPLNPPVLVLDEVAFMYNKDKVIFNSVNLNANLESRICIVSGVKQLGSLRPKQTFCPNRSVKMERAKRHC